MIVYGGFDEPPSPGEVWALTFSGKYSLSVTTSGGGSVSKAPNHASYDAGTQVLVTATPAPGWHFTGWSGDVIATDNPLTVTVNNNTSLLATFELDRYTIGIGIVGSGTVGKSPDQLDYAYGDVVMLTETPGPGWTFAGWSGDATGVTSQVNVTMNGNRSVTATFTDEGLPTAHVSYPNGGEVLVVGSDYKFTWEAADLVGVTGVDLELSRNDGATWKMLAERCQRTGTYVWTANEPGTNTEPHA
jgi:uncharacterized repeat protein (TIGR02543 family)